MTRDALIIAATSALLVLVTDADIRGTAAVVDGDTIVVDGKTVRLEGIDAPEMAQTCLDEDHRAWQCGHAAAAALRWLIKDKPVHCALHGRDRYWRLLGTCHAGNDAQSLNEQMVALGLARAFVRYSTEYLRTEEIARAGRQGLWRGEHVAPWDWRAAR